MSTLRKVNLHASSPQQLRMSALFKINEFIRLGYPHDIIRYMCSVLAKETCRQEWINIKSIVQQPLQGNITNQFRLRSKGR